MKRVQTSLSRQRSGSKSQSEIRTKSTVRMDHSIASEDRSESVNVKNFELFLPWACSHYNVNIGFDIKRVEQFEAVSSVSVKTKAKEKAEAITNSEFEKLLRAASKDSIAESLDIIHIVTSYIGDYLVHIKITKNKHLPRQVLRILGLAVRYYTHLQGISIDSGIDNYTMYELAKILPNSNITEIYLDNTFVAEANYDILLECQSRLKLLSLSKCKINDVIVNNIASKLEYPLPACQTLSILNLSSNQITDTGAKYLAKMLRTNRHLSYLNLAGNMIGDEGAIAILKALDKFCLTLNEILTTKRRYTQYLRNKQQLINKAVADNKKVADGKRVRKASTIKKPFEIHIENQTYYNKAKEVATSVIGEFNEHLDTFPCGELLYSYGNNMLAYLNLSYNNITILSIKFLLSVLQYQKRAGRKPKGLINVHVDGNPLPTSCDEFNKIDILFDSGLGKKGNLSVQKKKKN